jgi:hypothetical protein
MSNALTYYVQDADGNYNIIENLNGEGPYYILTVPYVLEQSQAGEYYPIARNQLYG